MLHNITTTRTSTELIEAYNARQTWIVPAPMGAKVGDDVMYRSSDGVDFQSWISGLVDDDAVIRIRG